MNLKSYGLFRVFKSENFYDPFPSNIRTELQVTIYYPSQNFTATLIMRIRSFLAFVISLCITFAFVPVKTFAFSERGNAQFTDVVNTGKANDCPP